MLETAGKCNNWPVLFCVANTNKLLSVKYLKVCVKYLKVCVSVKYLKVLNT